MKLAFIYGAWSSQQHPPFDISTLYRSLGLTGSESSFFNTARGLAELGHDVVIFCNSMRDDEQDLDGCAVLPLALVPHIPDLDGLDAVISWNEPSYLQHSRPETLRICAQQLNDFSYCPPGSCDYPHLWVLPSENHRQYLARDHGLPLERGIVIPNSVNLEMFQSSPPPPRDPLRVIWCSSPDRGLHHLLGWWPEIKRRVPGATLAVFYRLAPFISHLRDDAHPGVTENARRARYIEEAMARLADPRWGVEFYDNVSNERMARELRSSALLAYPCDPIRYTEGFGVSVLDACAAGCQPIISDADAMAQVHGAAATVIAGRPGDQRNEWIGKISDTLSAPVPWRQLNQMDFHAAAHSRQTVAGIWANEIMAAKARIK